MSHTHTYLPLLCLELAVEHKISSLFYFYIHSLNKAARSYSFFFNCENLPLFDLFGQIMTERLGCAFLMQYSRHNLIKMLKLFSNENMVITFLQHGYSKHFLVSLYRPIKQFFYKKYFGLWSYFGARSHSPDAKYKSEVIAHFRAARKEKKRIGTAHTQHFKISISYSSFIPIL